METSRIFLSFLLSCAAAAHAQAQFQAQAEFQYTADNGKITITRYDCSDAAVIIPDTINGLPVTTLGDFSFWGCTNLTSVIVPNSVTTIGVGAFWICTSLSSVVIGGSVATIGESAFGGCTDLASITIWVLKNGALQIRIRKAACFCCANPSEFRIRGTSSSLRP